jgi:hypothetical protein
LHTRTAHDGWDDVILFRDEILVQHRQGSLALSEGDDHESDRCRRRMDVGRAGVSGAVVSMR